MKTATRLTQDYVDFLRKNGLKVQTIPGWQTRGRPASTGRLAATGQLNHHTGSSAKGWSRAQVLRYMDFLFKNGRSDLPAPLCQGSVGRDGTVYIGAALRGNHAGKAKKSGPMPAGDGNQIYLGWEHQNNGTEGWPKEQYEAMVLLNALTAIYFGWPASHSRAHKETSITGKWDPGSLYMPRFRDDIAAAIRGTKEPKMNNVQLGRVDLAQSISLARKALDHFDDAPKSRAIVWAQIKVLRGAIALLQGIVRTLPEK